MGRKAREQKVFKKQNKYGKGGSKNPLPWHNTNMQDASKLGTKPSCTDKECVKIQLVSIQHSRIVSGLNYPEAHQPDKIQTVINLETMGPADSTASR